MEIIEEFIQALDEEIEAIKAGKGGSIVKIFNGQFIRESAGLFVYVFHLENFLAVLDESPAEIQIEGKNFPVQVLSTQGLEVEIGIEQSLGEFIPEARLQTNLWYLLELLKKKYLEIKEGQNKQNFQLSQILFDQRPISSRPTTHSKCRYYLSGKPPNEDQKKAIEASFRSQVCIIWGPPGTGKTKTIAQAIEAHLHLDRRVLLVSHANNAVDEALEDVAEQLKNTKFYNEGKLVRLGKPQEKHLKILEEQYEMVLPDKIAAKLGDTLTQEREKLVREKTQIDQFIDQCDQIQQKLQSAKTLSAEIAKSEKILREAGQKFKNISDELEVLIREKNKIQSKLNETVSAGRIKKFLLALNPEKIKKKLDHISFDIETKKQKQVEFTESSENLVRLHKEKNIQYEYTQKEVEAFLNNLKLSPEQLLDRSKELNQRKTTIQIRINEINERLDEIQKKIFSEARLVATTLTKTYVAKQFPDIPFDVMVLDEASMAPLPQVYWSAGRCNTSLTVVGDFLQLPPICISDGPMAKKWLGRSIFTIMGVDTVPKTSKDSRVTLLSTQYRMAPEISFIPNHLFYDNKLHNHSLTMHRQSTDELTSTPLVLVETQSVNPWCSRLEAGSRFNLYNALVCGALARRLVTTGNRTTVGIITPYAPQARLINKIAKDWELLDRLKISTVHRFQGGEEETIIFDTVEGAGTFIAPMVDDTRDSFARLLLNVALTRAKNKIYLVGNSGYLLSGLRHGAALRWVIQYFQEKGTILKSENLIDNYFTADFERFAEEVLPSPSNTPDRGAGGFYNEKNFWPQFFADLKTVQTRVIILSPFITIRRSGKLMDYFKAMMARGVKIQILTRPKYQQNPEMSDQTEMVVKQLRDIGVVVMERAKMHQKIAILDDIAWEGSLNILSHRDSQEQMRRYQGQSAVDELIRNLELENQEAIGNQSEEICPESGCGGFLVIRQARFGRRKFLGCSNYPKCKFTKPLYSNPPRSRPIRSHKGQNNA